MFQSAQTIIRPSLQKTSKEGKLQCNYNSHMCYNIYYNIKLYEVYKIIEYL
jgi:hypothetical protein